MWKWFILVFISTIVYAKTSNMKTFPLKNYSQNVNLWLDPKISNYNDNLLDQNYQQQHLNQLKHTYFGTANEDNSPWSAKYIEFILNEQTSSNNIIRSITTNLDRFDNSKQENQSITFAANDKAHSGLWLKHIARNIDLTKFNHLTYLAQNRAIAVSNLKLRAIPTADPAYYSSKIAGEGYPFDNIQYSSIYAGTSLYILGMTQDKQWYLVMAPEYIGWVEADGVAHVDSKFIQQWQKAAYANLVGIKQSNVSIMNQNGKLMFNGYVGMIFPLVHQSTTDLEILIPAKQANGMATILHSKLPISAAAILPIPANMANFAMLFKTLQSRAYGWGGLNFNNDCSAEMKAIFTMFGFFMPRNAKNQIFAGKMVDISKLDAKARLDYLTKHGDPLLTLVHIKGHVLLYVGTYKKDSRQFILSYQQMWGLAPKDRNSRSVIGKSVFFPVLTSYPEDPSLVSELDNGLFQVVYLNKYPDKPLKQSLNQLLGN